VHFSQRAAVIAAILMITSWASAAPAEPAFTFGSYGRVGVATEGDGRATPRQITWFGPRLIEDTYLELDFSYRAYRGPDADVTATLTVAFFDDLFHYTGQTEATLALRRAFLEARNLWQSDFSGWAGSRWVRGDDIYLLNVWPMDDLNVVGGGFGWHGPHADVTFTLGLNQLENGQQVQRVPVPAASDFFAEDALLLDRQKRVAALKAEQRWGGSGDALGIKLRLYAELHHLPAGARVLDGSFNETEPLPDDRGWLVGAQLGLWNFAKRGHLNLWLRYATGLTVFDELGTPTRLNRERRAVDAQDLRLAFAGNHEGAGWAVQYGGYWRWFDDGDPNETDFDDRNEVVLSARPQLNFGLFTPGLDLSTQIMRANGLNPRTLTQDVAVVHQIGLVPALTFADDPGSFSRPQIRPIYAIALLNDAALDLYANDDPRSKTALVHYLGLSAEWWFGRGGSY
jgi:maltoporin